MLEEIHFTEGSPTFKDYLSVPWPPGLTKLVEFYPGKLSPVTVIDSSDPSLLTTLRSLIDGTPISIDLEWVNKVGCRPIELYQFATSKGAVVVLGSDDIRVEDMKQFLVENKFFGKGMGQDKRKLKIVFDTPFVMEDIETSRLSPNELTLNFVQTCLDFIGPSCAQFKDHKIQSSNWAQRPLSVTHILYGAHDAIAMYWVYQELQKLPKYIAPNPVEKQKPPKPKKTAKCCAQQGMDFLINLPPIHPVTFIPQNLSQAEKFMQFLQMKKRQFTPETCFYDHSSQILPFLLPKKTKKTFALAQQKIAVATDLCLRGLCGLDYDRFYCIPCGHHYHTFLDLCNHCDSLHVPPNPQFPEIGECFVRYLFATKQVNCPNELLFGEYAIVYKEEEEEDAEPMQYNEDIGIKCLIDGEQFTDKNNLIKHCLNCHFDKVPQMVVKTTIHKEYEDMSCFCINELGLAEPTNELALSFRCRICGVEVQDLWAVFVHVLKLHLWVSATSARNYDEWPLGYNKIPLKMRPVVDFSPFQALETGGIIDSHNNCIECGLSFSSDNEKMEHIKGHHLILVGPPKP